MTDGYISLHSECCDGENRCIGGHFREHTAHDAHGVREGIHIRIPKVVQLLGDACRIFAALRIRNGVPQKCHLT